MKERTVISSAALIMAAQPAGLDDLEVFVEGLDHPEGIAVGVDGTMYVGGEAGQIYAIGDDLVPRQVANTGGFVLGLAIDGDGLLYVCDETRRSLLCVDPSSGDIEVVTSGSKEQPMRCPNWPAFDARGNLYVSDSGGWNEANGLIWVIRPGRRLEVFTEESVDFPNGLAVAPDGSSLYAVESTPGRLIEIPVNSDGSSGRRRVLCELGYVVPDGVAVADDGSLVISCYRPDAIYRWSEDDGLAVLASDPQGTLLSAPTNAAFIGDDLEVLVVPNLAGWHLTRGRLGVRGTPLARPSGELLRGEL
jgi:gluconolactonase